MITADIERIVAAVAVADPDLAACWSLVLRAMDYGWIDREALSTLRTRLAAGEDFLIEDFRLEHLGAEIRVSVFDERCSCQPPPLLALVERAIVALHAGPVTR